MRDEHEKWHLRAKLANMDRLEELDPDAKVYWPRLHPMERNTDRQFVSKYRLDKATVEFLAERYGESDFSGMGSAYGSGLSHVQTVSEKKEKINR